MSNETIVDVQSMLKGMNKVHKKRSVINLINPNITLSVTLNSMPNNRQSHKLCIALNEPLVKMLPIVDAHRDNAYAEIYEDNGKLALIFNSDKAGYKLMRNIYNEEDRGVRIQVTSTGFQNDMFRKRVKAFNPPKFHVVDEKLVIIELPKSA